MQPTPFPLITALRKGISVRGYTLHEITHDPKLVTAAKQYIFERLQDGRFQPKIAKTFPLEQAIQAYQYLESNTQIGKVVVTVNGEGK